MELSFENSIETSTVLVYSDQKAKHSRNLDVITCEYPPSIGGVADYTYKVVEGLRKLGISTHVWAPGDEEVKAESPDTVTRSLGRFGLRRLLLNDRLMGRAKDKHLLVQWEPVGFGLKALNLPFCMWIASRVVRGSRLVVMFHETFLPVEHTSIKSQSVRQRVTGALRRLMAFTLVNSAHAVFVSHGNGAAALRRLCFNRDKVRQLPVFSNIDSDIHPEDAVYRRRQFASAGEILIGHFGRFMETVEPLVLPSLLQLLQKNPRVKILFIGECGARYRPALLKSAPEFESRVYASGICSSKEAASLISACDFMFQPYPSGISTKRGSTMAALANGRYLVSTRGCETENIWEACAGVCLVDTLDTTKLAEQLNRFASAPEKVRRGSIAATSFYKKNFSVERTVEAIASAFVDVCDTAGPGAAGVL